MTVPHHRLGNRPSKLLSFLTGTGLLLGALVGLWMVRSWQDQGEVGPAVADAQSLGVDGNYMPELRTGGYLTPTATLTPSPTPTVTMEPASRPLDARAGAGWESRRSSKKSVGGEPTSRDRALAPLRRAAIAGFGESLMAVQGTSSDPVDMRLFLSKRRRDAFHMDVALGPTGAYTHALAERTGTEAGFWHGRLSSSGPVQAIVHTTWPMTATAAYEAMQPAKNLVLPLIARNIDGVYSIYTLQNADDDSPVNRVVFQYFSADDGSIMAEWEERLEPGDVVDADTIEPLSGLSSLSDTHPSAFLGSLRVRAEGPVALLTYANVAFQGGVGALRAQPQSRASKRVHLPLLRANYLGDSLIAVTNPTDAPVGVTIRFVAAVDSPSAPGAVTEHTFSIAPRSGQFVDLAGRYDMTGGATVNRGTGPHSGFLGSATIAAESGVLVGVLERTRVMTFTRAAAAYDGFVDDDLATEFGVPHVRHEPDHLTTMVAIQNPGDGEAEVAVRWIDAEAVERVSRTTVPAGEMRLVSTSGPAFTGRALISSSSPVAALVYETPFKTAADVARKSDPAYDTAAHAAPRLLPGVELPTPGRLEPSPTKGRPGETPAPSATSPTPKATPGPVNGLIYLPAAIKVGPMDEE